MTDRARSIGQVYTVKPDPFSKQCVIGNHQSNVTGIGHPPHGVGRAQEAVFVAGAEGEPHAGNRVHIQDARQQVGKGGEFDLGRGNKVKLRLIGRIHGGLSFALLRVN